MAALLRLAWRLIAGRPALAWLALGCIAVGVAARGTVAGAVAAVEADLARNARALLTADLELSSSRALDAATATRFREALPPGARTAEACTLPAMVTGPEGALLADLVAVGPGWPLTGGLRGEPAGSEALLHGDAPAVLVDPEVLTRTGTAVGGELGLGTARLRIAGTIAAEPAPRTAMFRLGPRIYAPLAALAAAGLTGEGVRARHLLLAALPDPSTAQPLARTLRARLKLPADQDATAGNAPTDVPVKVRAASEAALQSVRAVGNAADILRLVALFALALGALGVAALGHGMMRAQAEDLAVLRVLGATRARAAGVFALQAAAIGLGGGLAGTALGAALGALASLAMGLAPALPGPADLGLGAGLGTLAALASAALPALTLARMQPLAVLRGEEPPPAPRLAAALVLGGTAALAALAAGLEVRSFVLGPLVALGAALTAVLLGVAGTLLLPLAARFRPRSFALRHGLANLARPGRRPLPLVVALGLAAALGTALLVLHASFAAQLAPGRAAALPAFFAIDVQDDQREAFTAALAGHGLVPNLRPQVRARLRSVDGEDATAPAAGGSREAQRGAHFRRREQNLTWAAAPGPGEELTSGRWPADAGECAVESGWARSVGVRIGSRLVFDVQGVEVAATISGLRRIDWWTVQPNFFVSFGPGALDGAPVVWLGTIPQPAPGTRAALVSELARAFPNVSLIDVAEGAATARTTISRAAAGVGAIAAVALLAGLAVVAGTAAATARERRAEAALIRALGGTRRTVALSLGTEFAAAALVAALVGTAAGLAGGAALTRVVIDTPTAIPWPALAALAATLAAAATATAVLTARRVWRVPPLAALE